MYMGAAGKNLHDNFWDHYKFHGKSFTVLPARMTGLTDGRNQEAEITD
jgi:hypothetical protein